MKLIIYIAPFTGRNHKLLQTECYFAPRLQDIVGSYLVKMWHALTLRYITNQPRIKDLQVGFRSMGQHVLPRIGFPEDKCRAEEKVQVAWKCWESGTSSWNDKHRSVGLTIRVEPQNVAVNYLSSFLCFICHHYIPTALQWFIGATCIRIHSRFKVFICQLCIN